MTPAPSRVEIARFPGNKRFAVTFSWDDGTIEDRRLVATMNEWGLKGTFNINSGILQPSSHEWAASRVHRDEVAALYAGHEVAIHTTTHPDLSLLDPSQVAFEVLDDRRALEDLVGYPVRGMAYPFGKYSPAIVQLLRSLGIVYARTGEQTNPCFPPADPLAWGTTAHMFTETIDGHIGSRFEKMRANPHAGGVYFIWGHSFEFARPENRWAELERRFKPLAGHADVWYCTNIELFDYEIARQRVVIAANKRTAFNPTAIAVTLLVDGRAIDIPPGRVVQLADERRA